MSSKLNFRQIDIRKINLNGYILSPFELKDYIDFEVKRVYFITNTTEGGETGSHCHKAEEELFAVISGSCTAVIDKGNGLEKIKMNALDFAIYVGNYVWHHFEDFSPDAVIVGISSTNHNPDMSDYIRDYEEYKKVMKEMS